MKIKIPTLDISIKAVICVLIVTGTSIYISIWFTDEILTIRDAIKSLGTYQIFSAMFIISGSIALSNYFINIDRRKDQESERKTNNYSQRIEKVQANLPEERKTQGGMIYPIGDSLPLWPSVVRDYNKSIGGNDIDNLNNLMLEIFNKKALEKNHVEIDVLLREFKKEYPKLYESIKEVTMDVRYYHYTYHLRLKLLGEILSDRMINDSDRERLIDEIRDEFIEGYINYWFNKSGLILWRIVESHRGDDDILYQIQNFNQLDLKEYFKRKKSIQYLRKIYNEIKSERSIKIEHIVISNYVYKRPSWDIYLKNKIKSKLRRWINI